MARRPKGKQAEAARRAAQSAASPRSGQSTSRLPLPNVASNADEADNDVSLPFSEFNEEDDTNDNDASPLDKPVVTKEKGKGKAVAKLRKPTGGTGKKRKVFAETGGIAHLIALSNAISSQHEDDLQRRVSKAHDKQAWQKGKRKEKQEGQKAGKAQSIEQGAASAVHSNNDASKEAKTSNNLLTKARARASLVAKTREKARLRKEGRRAADRGMEIADEQLTKEKSPRPKRAKRVSFA